MGPQKLSTYCWLEVRLCSYFLEFFCCLCGASETPPGNFWVCSNSGFFRSLALFVFYEFGLLFAESTRKHLSLFEDWLYSNFMNFVCCRMFFIGVCLGLVDFLRLLVVFTSWHGYCSMCRIFCMMQILQWLVGCVYRIRVCWKCVCWMCFVLFRHVIDFRPKIVLKMFSHTALVSTRSTHCTHWFLVLFIYFYLFIFF